MRMGAKPGLGETRDKAPVAKPESSRDHTP